ncbi:MAG: hypothetical protein UY48_C0021G0009 [Candidatus Gottesmanbacteria bacterium GW2011_GWB1_49_7]|uniref:Uncharacterized protein n=1 Tax=Candidatus Gottesmanbacteria bacterium GW2011_GWB1_49_7 TaxID=1618448 RepID=A0A0G1Y8X0_9BACT|nr:MAG: hypothetical protein UY48_C0021G0009 [Candidatus Gottesmanbacteria bacterium GW2011_GWB1_49_7]
MGLIKKLNDKPRSRAGYSIKAIEEPGSGKDREGIIRFRLTELAVDRYSEVVVPDGGKLDNYKRNPVLLFAHNNWAPPVGKLDTPSFEQTPQHLDADGLFATKLDDFSRLLYDMYINEFMNAVSIGFMPIEWSDEPMIMGQKGITFKVWELLEVSCCPVPALPSALQAGKSITDIDLDFYTESIKQFINFREKAEQMGRWGRDLDAIWTMDSELQKAILTPDNISEKAQKQLLEIQNNYAMLNSKHADLMRNNALLREKHSRALQTIAQYERADKQY